jgi:hypothetical protein
MESNQTNVRAYFPNFSNISFVSLSLASLPRIYFRIPEKTENGPSEKFFLMKTCSLVSVNKEFLICTSCSGVDFLKDWEIIRHITQYFQVKNKQKIL